jgi:hypothetical protein
MAQNPITLEEAAERLGLEPSEFKRLLKTDPAFKVLSQIRDGANVRFKPAQIEELGRNLGAASDPGLPLANIGDQPLGSDDFKLHGSSDSGTPVEQPLEFGSTDDDIFSLSEPSSPAGKNPKGGKPDSDVRLEASGGKSKKPDSDVRLEGKKKSGKDSAVIPTEEIAIDFSGPGSAIIKGGSSAKLSAPKSSGKIAGSDSGSKGLSKPGTGDSSEFELSLDADSDDFELQLNTDTSDEVDLGAMPQAKAGGKPKAGESGINLRDPADSGISLEKKNKGKPKPKAPDDSSDDFELSLDPGPGASSAKLTGPRSGKSNKAEPVTSDSDSEFELTLDDSGGSSSLEHAALDSEDGDKNDIFETDFEIPPMSDESGSEAVALESDTDLESSDEMALNDSDMVSDDDTGSQVVMLEDEAAVSVDDSVDLVDVEDEEAGIGAALKGVKGRRRHDEEEEEPVTVGPSKAVPWGVWPSVFLFPAFVLVIIGGLIGFELLHTMWGYQQPKKPSTPIVRGIAKTLDMEVKDQ